MIPRGAVGSPVITGSASQSRGARPPAARIVPHGDGPLVAVAQAPGLERPRASGGAMNTPLLAFLLCVLPRVVAAGEVPAGFQGLRWGASPGTLTQMFPATACQPETPASPLADIVCGLEAITVGGVKTHAVRLNVYVTPARPSADGFYAYTLQFSPRDFDRMALAFRVRYGEPHTRAAQKFKKRDGLHDTNLVLTWEWPTVEARLERFAGRTDRSFLSVGTRAGRSEALRRIEAQLK